MMPFLTGHEHLEDHVGLRLLGQTEPDTLPEQC
jgi:hypothetical protein